jgi:hypothetical protein
MHLRCCPHRCLELTGVLANTFCVSGKHTADPIPSSRSPRTTTSVSSTAFGYLLFFYCRSICSCRDLLTHLLHGPKAMLMIERIRTSTAQTVPDTIVTVPHRREGGSSSSFDHLGFVTGSLTRLDVSTLRRWKYQAVAKTFLVLMFVQVYLQDSSSATSVGRSKVSSLTASSFGNGVFPLLSSSNASVLPVLGI